MTPPRGGLSVSLLPADPDGYRAVKRISYAQFSPSQGATIPAGITVPQINLPIYEDECRISSVSGINIDFNFSCPAQFRSRKSRQFEVSTPSSPTMHRLIGDAMEADGQSLSMSYIYDAIGNVISSVDARGNASFTTYDARRRKVFEIARDPDGNGPLPRPMVRHVYNSDGNETRTEVGVGFAADGSDFVMQRYKRMTYLPGMEKVVKVEEVQP